MNPKLITLGLTTVLALAALAGTATAAEKDPTKYDCRETVRVERYFEPGSRVPGIRFVRQCPHKEQLAAGQCETSWLWGMRCKK